MNISIIGTGYVGLPTGVGLAELGNQVTCIDKDEHKISDLRSGKITLFESGVETSFPMPLLHDDLLDNSKNYKYSQSF
jgi:UDPglucose 6-dehydrogenase